MTHQHILIINATERTTLPSDSSVRKFGIENDSIQLAKFGVNVMHDLSFRL